MLSFRRAFEKKDEPQNLKISPQTNESNQFESEVIRLKNIGTNPDPKINDLEALPGKSNYFLGSNPNDSDTDNDGIPDELEIQYFGNLNQDATSDFDNDGLPNGWELEYGFDPTDPNTASLDPDEDGYCGDVDNCPTSSNADQLDAHCQHSSIAGSSRQLNPVSGRRHQTDRQFLTSSRSKRTTVRV